MSKDLKNAKKGTGSIHPEGAIDAVGLKRVESLITAERVVSRFLGGIALIYPTTKQKITSEDINDAINRAANLMEAESQIDVQPIIRRIRLPFDPYLYQANIWIEVPYKPVQKVLRLAICSASYQDTSTENQNAQYPSGGEIYKIPNEWVDLSYAAKGKIFVNPINPAFTALGTGTAVSGQAGAILQFIGQTGWTPAYWTAEVITGFCTEDGQVPVIINEMLGMKAAILLIDNLIPSYKIASQSLGIDGLSQSVNDLTYQLLQQKRQQLDADLHKLVNRIKMISGNTFFVSNV